MNEIAIWTSTPAELIPRNPVALNVIGPSVKASCAPSWKLPAETWSAPTPVAVAKPRKLKLPDITTTRYEPAGAVPTPVSR